MEGYCNSLCVQDFYIQAPSVWVRHPKSCSSTSSIFSGGTTIQNTPSLILLFSWTSAAPRPMSKYTTDYIEMFPNTPIIIITTTLSDLAFKSEKQKQALLAPAVDFLTSRHLDSNIHAHCFSEGGSHKAIQFAEAYLSRTGSRLPITSLCLDSTPGDHQYHRIARAFRLSLPPYCIVRTLGLIFAYLMLTCLWFFYAIYGPRKNLMTRIRRGLQDQRLWDIQHIPRCYLYSERDSLIKYQDVERHAMKAERKGVPVLLVKFQESEHCHHIREDPGKYWSAVQWTLRMAKESYHDHRGGLGSEKEKEVSSIAPKSAPVVSRREITVPEPVAQPGH